MKATSRPIPRDAAFDSTLSMLTLGYRFIAYKCGRMHSDIFQTRLLGQKTICMQGVEAAQLFYDENRFARRHAMPLRVQKTLVGVGGVQGLDGEEHLHRKRMFLTLLMSEERIAQLVALTRQSWELALEDWVAQEKVVLLAETQRLLCRAACAWTGVPLTKDETGTRAADLGLMIDSGGRMGWHHWRGRLARKRCERWIARLVRDIRANRLSIDKDEALYVVAWHRDLKDQLLPPHTAAVEILNILRPTVAIAQLVVYCAMSLHQYPYCREQLLHGSDDYWKWFIHEVRRFYPFFPFLPARVKHDFNWRGYRFKKNTRVLLDIYGTNHHEHTWQRPELFQPERFRTWDGSPYNFIANGGADPQHHHRCPGEWITEALMKVAMEQLLSLHYRVPPQDLRLNFNEIPSMPASGFVIDRIERR